MNQRAVRNTVDSLEEKGLQLQTSENHHKMLVNMSQPADDAQVVKDMLLRRLSGKLFAVSRYSSPCVVHVSCVVHASCVQTLLWRAMHCFLTPG